MRQISPQLMNIHRLFTFIDENANREIYPKTIMDKIYKIVQLLNKTSVAISYDRLFFVSFLEQF